MTETGVSVGILTALVNPELTSAAPILQKSGWVERQASNIQQHANIRTFSKSKDGNTATVRTAAIGEMGQTHAAIETAAFLERARPTVVILCGICGSLDEKKLPKEDVVVAKSVDWKGFNKLQDGDLFDCFREKTHALHPQSRDFQNWYSEFFSTILATVKRDTFSVHFEDIFSWEYVTTGKRATDKVKQISPSSACVEMEAGGYLAAVSRYAEIRGKNIPAFVVRGVSDYTLKKDKDMRVRRRASENAIEVAQQMAEHFLLTDSYLINHWT